MIDNKTVQQLKEYDPKRMKYPCYGQVKMDGIFGRWSPDKKKFYTRSGNMIQGLSVLESEMAEYKYPYDGELVIPGMDFFKMNGLIRSFKETPDCKFYIFDAPHDIEVFERRLDWYQGMNILHKTKIVLMKAHLMQNDYDADTFYDKVLTAGHEGVVYKQPTAQYQHGKHWTYLKRVPIKTCECTILSAYEGQGKLKGKLGGFVVDFNGLPVKVGGGPGVDYALRTLFWKERENLIGQPMKCQYKKVTEKGSMRSPQMLGVRWDI